MATIVIAQTPDSTRHRAFKVINVRCRYMLFSAEILSILLFVGLMVLMPFALGSVVRLMLKPSQHSGNWMTFAYVMTILGWTFSFGLGKAQVMSYQASVLLGSVLYIPGIFLIAYHSKRPKQP